MTSHHYGANSAWQQISVLGHNLLRSFQIQTTAPQKPRSRNRRIGRCPCRAILYFAGRWSRWFSPEPSTRFPRRSNAFRSATPLSSPSERWDPFPRASRPINCLVIHGRTLLILLFRLSKINHPLCSLFLQTWSLFITLEEDCSSI